jgi:hypothetical protein
MSLCLLGRSAPVLGDFELVLTSASLRDPVGVVALSRDLNFVELIAGATVHLHA